MSVTQAVMNGVVGNVGSHRQADNGEAFSVSATVRLVADIGGTNARFALFSEAVGVHQEMTFACADYADITAAIQCYLSSVGHPKIKQAALAIANPITGDWVEMTNHQWAFSIDETCRVLGFDEMIFKNDFTALAMSIPLLAENELRQVGGVLPSADVSPPVNGSSLAVIGPGTGLGVSGLLRYGDQWIPIEGEGGHVTVSPCNARECDILNVCWQTYSHVSAERLVSGMGLQNLYHAICQLEGVEAQAFEPAEVSALGLRGSDPYCAEALAIFCGLLGSVAGDLVLTLGAFRGVYIGGGIVPRLGSYFETSAFRERFEAKGRFQKHLEQVPAFVIHAKNPALSGISQAFTLND